MTTPVIELKPCACGCGEMVKGTWKRGHSMRARAKPPEPLPGPDDELPDIDLGEAIPGPLEVPDWVSAGPAPSAGQWPGNNRPGETPGGPGPADEPEEIAPDPEPAHLRDRRRTGSRGQRKGPRVTKAIEADIGAKVDMLVTLPGMVWEARDPVCGGRWMSQSEKITAAFTKIALNSPDLIAWFTGPAGGFMQWFELVMALQPVAMTVWAHHIAHTITIEPAQPAPGADARANAQAYAA